MNVGRISPCMLHIWGLFLHEPKHRFSNAELAQRLTISEGTARRYTKAFAEARLLDRWHCFPCSLYRLSPEAATRNPEAYERLTNYLSVLSEE